MATPPKEGHLLYHMTRLENMPSILEYGLLSRKRVQELKTDFKDIADHEILAGRENIQSPRPLSEYVPFHFFVKNPFDGNVCREYSSENMAIIAIYRDLAQNLNFPIITAHPLSSSAKWFDSYQEGLSNIDWDTLNKRDYRDRDSKLKCMAECLAPDSVQPESFACIFVYDEDAQTKIRGMTYIAA